MTDTTLPTAILIFFSALTGTIVGAVLAHEFEPAEFKPLRFDQVVGRQDCRTLSCMRGLDRMTTEGRSK